MHPTLTAAETAVLEALLGRLDPAPAGRCTVSGCLHVHAGSSAETAQPLLAA